MINPLNIVYGVLSTVLVSAVGLYIWDCKKAGEFKDKAAVLAEAARDKAIKQSILFKKAKEKADVEITSLTAANNSLGRRLHDERARASRLSALAARPPSPERACFKGPLLDAAITRLINETAAADAELDAGLSRIVEQGDGYGIALEGLKVWAAELPK